jgi:hypothetical protein
MSIFSLNNAVFFAAGCAFWAWKSGTWNLLKAAAVGLKNKALAVGRAVKAYFA